MSARQYCNTCSEYRQNPAPREPFSYEIIELVKGPHTHKKVCIECGSYLAFVSGRKLKYDNMLEKFYVEQMNETESKFVFESVLWRVMHDVKLSEKQRTWLRAIMNKYRKT